MKSGALLIAGLAVAVAGCSSSTARPADGSSSKTPSASGSSTKGPASTQDVPPLTAKFVGIRKDVKLSECTLGPGNVHASGTVKNTASQARDVVVAVVWMRPKSDDTLYKQYLAKASVKAGASVAFDFKGKVSQEASQCVVIAKADRVGSIAASTSGD